MRQPARLLLVILVSTQAYAADEDQHRAALTLQRMDAIAQTIVASIGSGHSAPDSLTGSPADEWGTPLRYVKTGDQSFEIISAGADRKFDEKSWTAESHTADFTTDAVYVKAGANRPGTFRRLWIDGLGAPLGQSTEEQKMYGESLAKSELERTKNMTPEESWSAIRTAGTIRTMFALAVIIERYRMKNGTYPRAASMGELARVLLPDSAADVEKMDWWRTEYHYDVTPDGKTFHLVSAGNDRTFDPKSWDQPGTLATTDDDAVIRNGEWVRKWDEKTRRGLTPDERRRAALRPEARTLLEKADALDNKHDNAAALDAYMGAVKADPAAASLQDIQRYAIGGAGSYAVADLPLPPPPPPPGEKPGERQLSDVEKREAGAVRQYLQLHPGDWQATQVLARLVPSGDAESLLEPFMKSRPTDPGVYAERGSIRALNRRYAQSLDDYVKAQELDPKNPERYYIAGVVAYEAVAKDARLTADQKRTLIQRGLSEMQRAEAMKPDYFEAMAYHNLLLRQQAQIETDPALQKKLIAEADAIRQQAVDIIKRRKSAGTATTEEAPLKVGGDVRAPVVTHRVEPEYPEEFRKSHISGIVILELIVDKSGNVKRATVLKPLPFGGGEAALAAVKQWTFQPGTRNGEPVDVIYNITVRMDPSKTD